MGDYYETAPVRETAVLVGLINRQQNEIQIEEYLDELEFLADTAGFDTTKRFTQKLDTPNVATFVGTGKLTEIHEFITDAKTDIVIFDDDLSPSQLRNLERALKVRIYDRSLLILEIFQQRARTSHARTQVELARYQYLLPRLTRMWTHLERQRGGTGTRGGAGEKEIETDRRIIRDKITRLKKELKTIDKQMATQRGNRGAMVRVALVGYTNVGKSTIMNLLSKSDVFAEDKLFATLDTTVRKVVLKNIPCLLSDTVGFIRKLPHQLIESFKSTLDEVREADILVHVLDISHENFEDHFEVVNETLKDIDALNKPTIVVLNKIDLYQQGKKRTAELENPDDAITLDGLRKSWMARMGNNKCVFISAAKKTNMEELREVLYHEVGKIHMQRFPYNNYLFPIIEDDGTS